MIPICGKCIFVEKTSAKDEYGNIHVRWQCEQTLAIVFSEIIYDAVFLQKLRNRELDAFTFMLAGVLPSDKSIDELKRVEVLHVRKAKTCKDYTPKLKPLTEY